MNEQSKSSSVVLFAISVTVGAGIRAIFFPSYGHINA
jgi:hypothetical protein